MGGGSATEQPCEAFRSPLPNFSGAAGRCEPKACPGSQEVAMPHPQRPGCCATTWCNDADKGVELVEEKVGELEDLHLRVTPWADEGLERRGSSLELVQLRTALAEHSRRIEALESQLRVASSRGGKSSRKKGDLRKEVTEGTSLDPPLEGTYLYPSVVGQVLGRRPPNDKSPSTPPQTPPNTRAPIETRAKKAIAPVGSPREAAQPKESNLVAPSAAPQRRLGAAGDNKVFDQDLLKVIYDKPYRKARQQGAMVGGGVLGAMSMPFGPIGMVAGGLLGGVVGGVIGHYVDKRTTRIKQIESEVEKRRLKSLVRWAVERFHDDEEFTNLIEMVTLEFKPIADIAEGSKHARKMLKLLDNWIAQKKVTRNLWVYMEKLLTRWRDLRRADFVRSMQVFQTLTTMYRYSTRELDEQEIQFLHRMERLLEHESVQLVIDTHAQMYPTQDQTRLMECMIYADVLNKKKRRNTAQTGKDSGDKSPSQGHASPSTPQNLISREESDDSEDDSPQFYQGKATASGLLLAPGDKVYKTLSSSSFSKESARSASPRQLDRPGGATKETQRVLKQPFFKNFQDFMEFDIEFKRKMPITLSEFDLLAQKDQESLKGWDVCVDRKEIKVAKVMVGTGLITLRAWATVPDVDMQVAFHLFYDFHERVKWDKIFAKMDMVEKDVQGSEILYSLMKVPAVTPRDFLQYRRVRVMDDGSIHIVLRSAEHQNMPEFKQYIRVESYISGYILRQTYEGSKPILKVFLMSCVDIKGLIPKWIINYTAPKAPAEWIANLKKAAVEYMAKHPGYKEELLEVLQPFTKPNPYDYEDAEYDAVQEGEAPASAPTGGASLPRGSVDDAPPQPPQTS